MRFIVLIVDDITSSYLRAIDYLKGKKYDCLFLDFLASTEAAFQYISYGASWREEIGALKEGGLLLVPEDSQLLRAAGPLFDYIQGNCINLFCYRDTFQHDLLCKLAGDMFALTASSRIFGIKASRWLSLIENLILTEIESTDRDVNYVIKKAEEENVIFGGEGLAENLLRGGYDVETMLIDQSVKPLDVLKRIVARASKEGRNLPVEIVEDLVREHLDFVDLIIRSESYEDAYELWKNKMHSQPPR